MEKTYIAFNDGRIGYIKNICTCDGCKERGQAEMFINDLNGIYLDCIKTKDVLDVIYIGTSLAETFASLVEYYKKTIERKEKDNEYLQSILNFYCNEIISQ